VSVKKELTPEELEIKKAKKEQKKLNKPAPLKKHQVLYDNLGLLNPDKINEDDFISDLLRTVIRMRHNKINESLRQLRFLQEEEQEQGQQQGNIPFQDLVLSYTQNLLKLNHALVVNQQIKQL